MDVKLQQRRIADCFETVNLSGLDDKDIATTTFESLAIDGSHSAAFTNELNFVIRMPMRTGPGTGLPVEQEDRHTGVALIGSDKLMVPRYARAQSKEINKLAVAWLAESRARP